MTCKPHYEMTETNRTFASLNGMNANHKKRLHLQTTLLAPLCVGLGLGALHANKAQAWPNVSYDQFDGEYIPVACGPNAPKAYLNVVVGSIKGDLSDPLGHEPNPDGTDKPPLQIVGVPLSTQLPVKCEDGRPELDLQPLTTALVNRCEQFVGGPVDCVTLAQELAEWQEAQTILTSPAIDSIVFDWHRNGFTWLFRSNASNTRYTFEDGNEAVVLDTLFLNDANHGFFTNFINSGGYDDIHEGQLLGNEVVCATGMLMHTDGTLDNTGLGVATGRMMTLPMVNCGLKLAEDDYLGFHVSVATEYSFVAER